jgi:hypothetical protein
MLTGALSNVIYKIMSQTSSKAGGTFNHPFIQSFIMFIGETMCFLLKPLVSILKEKYGMKKENVYS